MLVFQVSSRSVQFPGPPKKRTRRFPSQWYVVSTVSKFVEQTWTQRSCRPSPCSLLSVPSTFRAASGSGDVLQRMWVGTSPFGPATSPTTLTCLLTCRRAWPGSVGLPSTGFSPATCSRRGRDALTFHLPQQMEKAPGVPCLCAVANATRGKTSDAHSQRH